MLDCQLRLNLSIMKVQLEFSSTAVFLFFFLFVHKAPARAHSIQTNCPLLVSLCASPLYIQLMGKWRIGILNSKSQSTYL